MVKETVNANRQRVEADRENAKRGPSPYNLAKIILIFLLKPIGVGSKSLHRFLCLREILKSNQPVKFGYGL